MSLTKRHFPAAAFALLILACTVAELVLEQAKHDVFSVGFLQPHPLTTFSQRFEYVAILLFFNVLVYGIAYLAWRAVFRRAGQHPNVIAFNFMSLAGIVTAVRFVAEFELHKYFADAVDAALLRDLAGGNLRDALLYVTDEILLFLAGCTVLVLVYLVVLRYARPFLVDDETAPARPSGTRFAPTAFVVIPLGLLLSAGLAAYVNTDGTLRHNLRWTNAYALTTGLLDTVSDLDRDGFGSFRFPTDEFAVDASIHPGALDVPGNGIDEDGLFGDFVLDSDAPVPRRVEPVIDDPMHIVVVVLESTRFDAIGKVIEGRQVAPNLTSLAESGDSFDEVYSHKGFTASSIISLFSGYIDDFDFDDSESLFPILKANGYRTGVFSGQDESFGQIEGRLSIRENVDMFFDARDATGERVYASKLPSGIQVSEETLLESFRDWSGRLDWSVPTFVYFNLQAPHFPYYHGRMTTEFVDSGIPRMKISPKNADWLRATYWNAVNYSDTYLGEIVSELERRGVRNDTLLIVTADHGEELFEEGHLGHGFVLSNVQTRVPFVTNVKGFELPRPAGLADVKAGILSYLSSDRRVDGAVDRDGPPTEGAPEPDDDGFVFQLIGPLDKPRKISLRYSSDEQIVLDMENMLVDTATGDAWTSFESAISSTEGRAALERLVHHWEHLRWQAHSIVSER